MGMNDFKKNNPMYKINWFIALMFSLWLPLDSCAMESQKDDLYLVVGNSRKEGKVNIWWKRIMGNETDFTHRSTFEGKATTLDLEPCALTELPHIQADAKTYNPGSPCIRAVFMELIPSIGVDTFGFVKEECRDAEGELTKLRLMPDIIRNLSLYMPSGATLEIEHLPHFTLLDSNFYAKFISYLRRKNPFHAFLSPVFMENLKVRDYLGAEQKIAYWSKVREQKLILGWSLEDANTIISEAARSHPILLEALSRVQQLLGINSESFNSRINADIKLYEKSPQKYFGMFHNALSSVVAQEFCLLSQQGAIKEFLEKKGFTNTLIQHQDNRYNGRKNVWMISAVKK